MYRLVFWVVLLLQTASAAATAPQTDEWIGQLAKLGLDRNQIYSVRELSIRRDVLSISLNRGTLAFTGPVAGKVTGAVFIGSGEILAIPPGRVEKQQLFRYTKAALLNERFEAAVFRFSDGTYEEILKELRGRAVEDVAPEEAGEILRWDSELQRRSRFLNGRILADFLAATPRPFFLAQIEGRGLGWFDAVYDERRAEEVLIEQHTSFSPQPVIWVSFDKRSEQRGDVPADPRAGVMELVAYDSAASVANLKLRIRAEGERVLDIPVPVSSDVVGVALITDSGPVPMQFLEGGLNVSVILPAAAKPGEELHLQMTYATAAPATSGFSQPRPGSIMPESYRDQWIAEGVANYAAAVSGGLLSLARSQLLEESPQGGNYDSLAPISVGFRMTQLSSTPAGAAALRNKSVWVLHMLRMLMRRGGDDSAFADMVVELRKQFEGGTISTADFRKLAEKYATQDLEWFFEQWVYGTGIPIYAAAYTIAAVANGFAVEGTISQSGVPEGFTMPVPVFADELFLGNVTVTGTESKFRFVTKTRPAAVHLDPNQTILAVIAPPSTVP